MNQNKPLSHMFTCWERVETSAPPSLIHECVSTWDSRSRQIQILHLTCISHDSHEIHEMHEMQGAKRAGSEFGRVRAWDKVAEMPPISSWPSSPYNIILVHPHLNHSNLTTHSLLEKSFSVAKFHFAISQGHHFPPFCSNSLHSHCFKAWFLVFLIGCSRGEEKERKRKKFR